jgi:hypothetical protein
VGGVDEVEGLVLEVQEFSKTDLDQGVAAMWIKVVDSW